ncbi:MAG: restriction endonuclease subunit S [Opitutales bacterium]|nr:restriction endonuclease subunit S [Opitutales bacterium]
MRLTQGAIKDFSLGIYDGPHATPKESEEGPIFLGIKNVRSEGGLDLSEIRHISENEYPRWTKRVVPQEGDIVFSYEATLHRYAKIPEDFRGCLGRRMGLVRPDPRKLDSSYLLYYFLGTKWRSEVESHVITGATVDRVPIKDFPDFRVSFPPLPIQTRIADILSAYDDLIENNKRRMQLLEEAARQLYREWFVRLRFPGHEHTKVVDGLPEGWERSSASEAISVNPRTKLSDNQTHPWVEMADLPTNFMVVSRYSHREGRTGSKFRNGDTLLARITPCLENGKTAYVNFFGENETGRGSTEFIVLRPRKLTPEMTYLLARTYDFRENAIKSMVGSSGRQRVQESCFEKFILAVPPPPLQAAFTETVRPMFGQIRNLTLQNQKLRAARDLFLPKLMNGEIAV